MVSGLLAVATWNLAGGYLVDQRTDGATSRADVNARLVANALGDRADGGLDDLLTGLAGGPATTVALRRADGWTTSGRRVDPADLPRPLLDLAASGSAGRQRVTIDGMPSLVVALPLAAERTTYVEVVPLTELDHTLRFLSLVLLVGIAVSSVLGLALGRWAGRRALLPLTELTGAAARVAAGDLQARLPEGGDAELAPLAATFNRTADALEKRVQRDIRFAGDVSHELRSPLTTLVNAVAVLRRRRDDLPEPARKAVDLLDADAQRFQRMVIDLLEISRTAAEDEEEGYLCDVVELVRQSAAHRPDPPPVLVEGTVPGIAADRRRIDRIVGNLLDNADSHGGGAVLVTVSGHANGARIQVDDAGPGVPLEYRTEVFERFARGAKAGSRGSDGGTGLGLALVAEHVRRHGGAAWIEDRPEGGARVIVDLPGAQA